MEDDAGLFQRTCLKDGVEKALEVSSSLESLKPKPFAAFGLFSDWIIKGPTSVAFSFAAFGYCVFRGNLGITGIR